MSFRTRVRFRPVASNFKKAIISFLAMVGCVFGIAIGNLLVEFGLELFGMILIGVCAIGILISLIMFIISFFSNSGKRVTAFGIAKAAIAKYKEQNKRMEMDDYGEEDDYDFTGVRCPVCGTLNDSDEDYCRKCGNYLDE